MSRPTLLYLVTEDWFFWSHRASLARAVRDAGGDRGGRAGVTAI